jgi:hypothetical protein
LFLDLYSAFFLKFFVWKTDALKVTTEKNIMIRTYFNLTEDEAKAILKNRRQRNEQNWKVREDQEKKGFNQS